MFSCNRIASISRVICTPSNIRTTRPVFSAISHIRLFTADAAGFPATETIFTQFDDRADLHRFHIDTLRKDIESSKIQDRTKKIDEQIKAQMSSHVSKPFFPARVPIPTSNKAHFYWHRVPQWKHVSEEQFLSYEWTVRYISSLLALYILRNLIKFMLASQHRTTPIKPVHLPQCKLARVSCAVHRSAAPAYQN
jgi:hypothetical protein